MMDAPSSVGATTAADAAAGDDGAGERTATGAAAVGTATTYSINCRFTTGVPGWGGCTAARPNADLGPVCSADEGWAWVRRVRGDDSGNPLRTGCGCSTEEATTGSDTASTST